MGQRLLPAACQDEWRALEGRQFLALSLQRSSFLYLNQSMISLCLATQGAIQRRSLDEIAEGQVRRGQIRRRSHDEVCGLNPAGCLAGPVYIHPGIQGGLGQIAFRIVIGQQSGMLWMLWAQEGPRMLHWGTPA